jgi:hypothetical protein
MKFAITLLITVSAFYVKAQDAFIVTTAGDTI